MKIWPRYLTWFDDRAQTAEWYCQKQARRDIGLACYVQAHSEEWMLLSDGDHKLAKSKDTEW